MMENKKTLKFVLLVAGIMAFVTIASISFAYFSTQIEEEGETYSLKGKANFGYHISFTESNEGVVLENTYPMLDEMGLQLDPYTFTVKNDEVDTRIGVKIVVEVLSTSNLEDNLINVSIGDEIKTLSSDLSVTPSEDAFRSAYEVFEFDLWPEEAKTYNLRTWINSSGTVENAQNKSWYSRILIVPVDYVEDTL